MQLRDVYCNSCSVPSKIENNRDIFVDMTKAIAILLMVIGHNEFSYWFGGLPRAIIFSFHMPCFFILSGYMHRQKDMRTTLKNNARSLLYPYLTFGILVYSIKIIGGAYLL